jgi:hypothetical protein
VGAGRDAGNEKPPSVSAAHEPAESQKIAVDQMDGGQTLGQKKHFLINRVIQPDLPTDPVVSVEIEAVFSKATQVICGLSCKMTAFGSRIGFERVHKKCCFTQPLNSGLNQHCYQYVCW